SIGTAVGKTAKANIPLLVKLAAVAAGVPPSVAASIPVINPYAPAGTPGSATYIPPEYNPAAAYAAPASVPGAPAGPLPDWVLPAAVGGGALLLLIIIMKE